MLSFTHLIMPPKRKNQEKPVNTLIPPSIDLDHIPLADTDYRFMRRIFNENHIQIHIADMFRTNECGSSSGQVEEPDQDCMLNRESRSSNGYI